MHAFRKLAVWQKAHALTLVAYRVTEGIAYRQYPGLAEQLRRAVLSLPASVAAGSGCETPQGFARFLDRAISATRQVDYLLLLAADLDAIDRSDHAKLEARNEQVRRMLVALRATIAERALLRPPRSARGIPRGVDRGIARERGSPSAVRRSAD